MHAIDNKEKWFKCSDFNKPDNGESAALYLSLLPLKY